MNPLSEHSGNRFRPACQATTAATCSFCHEPNTAQPVTSRMSRCAACGFLASNPHANYASDAPVTPEPLPLQPGVLLRDRYRIIRLLGQGEYGTTFLAHHEFLNHPCVVKVLPYRVDSDTDAAVRRMRGEASAGYRVHHTRVVRVLDADVWDGIWYFVMEYVEGTDLSDIVAHGVCVDWRQAVQFAIDAAEGLHAIHQEGLVHRDIKPGNLILGRDGRIRVTDLGIARLLQKQQEHGPAFDHPRAGTLAYAAPEMFSGNAEIGPAADLYSLGVTIFELITGSLPRGMGVYRTALGPQTGSITWPASAPDGVPDWLIKSLLRLLEEKPDARFESADSLAHFLEHPSSALPPRVRHSENQPPRPQGVIVLPFENGSGEGADDWLGHALADHLGRSLSRTASVYVADLDQFLPTLERIRQREPNSRTKQLLDAGRLSGAGSVVEGVFRRKQDRIELDVRIHQAGQDESQSIGEISGALSSIAELENELFRRIIAALEVPADLDVTPPAPRARNSLAAEEKFFAAKRSFLRGDYKTAMQLGQEAIEIDPKFGDAFGFVGACCTRMGLYEQAVEYNRRQERLADEENDERFLVQARANMGSMHYFRGEYAAAQTCLEQALNIAEKLELTAEPAQIRNNLGFVLLQLGRQSEAGEAFTQAIETLKKYGVLVALVGPYNGLGHVLREQKRYDQARQYFRRALALAQESDDNVNMGIAYMNLGQCALLQGRLADAKHELAVAQNILEQTSFWNGLARVFEYMTDLNLRLANCDEAIRCADRRIELTSRHANLHMEQAAWRQKAEALRMAGSNDEAELCLKRASQGHEDSMEPSAAASRS